MVHGLVERLLTVLRQAFAIELATADDHLVAGPRAAPAEKDLPQIVLSPGALEFETRFEDEPVGKPRPREEREILAVRKSTPAGPYPLTQVPLAGSLYGRLVFAKGEVSERRVALHPEEDLVVDPAGPSIVFTRDLGDVDEILLTYSYVGIFAMRELSQEVLVDLYADNPGAVERLGSLVTGIVLSDQAELLEHTNRASPTTYGLGVYTTRYLIDRLALRHGSPVEVVGQTFHQRLSFHASGRLEAARASIGDVGLVERVRSPRRHSEHAIDVEPEVALDSTAIDLRTVVDR